MKPPRLLRLETATRRPFHAAVKDASDAVIAAGGWIVSHQFFSNRLAMLACQLPAAALPAFAQALTAAGLGPIDIQRIQSIEQAMRTKARK